MRTDQEIRKTLLEGLWWGVVVLHIWAIWGIPAFLTQDGPAHLYSASVFLQLLGGDAPVLEQIYEINLRLMPNWLGSGLLIGLSSFAGFEAGEKLLISLYVLGIAAGFRAVQRALGLKDPWGKFLVLPLIMNHYLFFGLYNFLLAVAGSLLLLAYGLKHLGALDARKTLLLGSGLVAVYFTHILPAALSGLALVCLLLFAYSTDREMRKEGRKQLGLLMVAGAPAALLGAFFLTGGASRQGVVWGRDLAALLAETVTASFLVPFRGGGFFWTTLCFVTLLVVSGWVGLMKVRQGRWGFADGFLLLSAGIFILQLVAPEGVQSGSLLSYRMGLYFWLAWVGWIVLQERILGRVPFSGLLGVVFLAAGISQPLYWIRNLHPIQPVVEELAQVVSHVPAHSEVWPVVLDPFGREAAVGSFPSRNAAFAHVALRSLASLEDVAARIAYQGEVPLFPVRFRNDAAVDYFESGYDARPADFPLLEELASHGAGGHPAFLLLVGEIPEGIPSGSRLDLLTGVLGDPVASAQSALGPILLYRLERPEAQPAGD